jgi:hypothetical protein
MTMNRSHHALFLTLAAIVSLMGDARAELQVAQKGTKLSIKGNGESDGFELDGTGTVGRVVFTVPGVTTANFAGITDIDIDTGAGNDLLRLNAIQIGGSLRVRTGVGLDTLDIDHTTSGGLTFPVIIGKNLDLRMGGQEIDFIDIDVESNHAFTIGGTLSIDGASDITIDGDGTKTDYEPNDLSIGGDLRIRMSVAIDFNNDDTTLDLDSLNVGGKTVIRLSNGNDQFELSRCTFVGSFSLDLRGGNDVLDFSSHVTRFESKALLNGGKDGDSFTADEKCVFLVAPVLKNFE